MTSILSAFIRGIQDGAAALTHSDPVEFHRYHAMRYGIRRRTGTGTTKDDRFEAYYEVTATAGDEKRFPTIEAARTWLVGELSGIKTVGAETMPPFIEPGETGSTIQDTTAQAAEVVMIDVTTGEELEKIPIS
jgi:hypothetical protein